MFHLPNLLVVSSTYSTHFSDSVCGRPTLRHCIRNCTKINWIFKQKWTKRLQLIKKCSELKTLFLVIRLRLCLEVKVQYPNAKSPELLVLAITLLWIVGLLYEFNKRLTLMKGYVAHSKRNSIFKVKVILRGQRPNYVQILPFRTITVLCKAYFQIVWEKSLKILIYTLKLSYIN